MDQKQHTMSTADQDHPSKWCKSHTKDNHSSSHGDGPNRHRSAAGDCDSRPRAAGYGSAHGIQNMSSRLVECVVGSIHLCVHVASTWVRLHSRHFLEIFRWCTGLRMWDTECEIAIWCMGGFWLFCALSERKHFDKKVLYLHFAQECIHT